MSWFSSSCRYDVVLMSLFWTLNALWTLSCFLLTLNMLSSWAYIMSTPLLLCKIVVLFTNLISSNKTILKVNYKCSSVVTNVGPLYLLFFFFRGVIDFPQYLFVSLLFLTSLSCFWLNCFAIHLTLFIAHEHQLSNCCKILESNDPAGISSFIVNNKNTRKSCQICSQLTIETPGRCHWRRSGVFIANYEHILLFPRFVLLTLNK